jgi:hypothetical protein
MKCYEFVRAQLTHKEGQVEGGWALEISEFFGPQMALAYKLDAISKGPKNFRIPGPNPLPLALVKDMHAPKT